MTGGKVAAAIVFFPAAPLLFLHGKDVTIPKGTEISADAHEGWSSLMTLRWEAAT
jgi:hypothetical protein